MQKSWERTFRRAGLRLAYSQGFHPQPKLQLASPLPLGFTSTSEVLDVWLEDEKPPGDLLQALQKNLIPGIEITRIEEIPLNASAIQAIGETARFKIGLPPNVNLQQLQEKIADILSASSIPRVWKGKSYDLRPRILNLYVAPDHHLLMMELSARESSTGRPEEVLSELGIDPVVCSIERTALIARENNQQIVFGLDPV